MKRILLYSVLFIGVSCQNKNTTASETVVSKESENKLSLTDEQMKNAGVELGTPQTHSLKEELKINGQVDVPPQNLVSISFPLGGYLKSSHLLPGTSVQKGAELAVMEDQSYVQLQQDYLVAKAKMEYLQQDVQRQKELSEHDAASKKSYQQVLSDFKTQQILIKALEEKLRIIGIDPAKLTVNNISRTVSIHSPISGYVTKVNVNIGKYVNPADVLFELVNPDDIHAAMTVFEKDIESFKKGMRGKVALADQPSKQFDVEVLLVTKNIADNRTGLVHCHFETPNHALLPGMFLTGTFDLTSRIAFALPEEAVVRYEGKQFVFVSSSKNIFTMEEVETGMKENGWIEIKEKKGIDWAHETVVTKNAYALLGKLKNKMED
ncbi:MAG: efflux RND transporter periplasmic adaptor subunit [Bacteroidota bacterium]|nr:efflux RND transporter periplasmic adaptor subunit [Bacteroidota bacterium]